MYILGPFHSRKYSSFSKILQTLFFPVKILPLLQITAKSDHIWRSKDQNIPKKGHFMDVNLVRNTLKIFNIATANATNAILIKLTTNVYVDQIFHLAKNQGVTLGALERVNGKPLRMVQKISFLA